MKMQEMQGRCSGVPPARQSYKMEGFSDFYMVRLIVSMFISAILKARFCVTFLARPRKVTQRRAPGENS